LDVCHNKRIWKHRVFKGIAARGKSSMGWFFGLKLHLTVNERGKITSFLLTPGNVADNNQELMVKLTENLTGKKILRSRPYICKMMSFMSEFILYRSERCLNAFIVLKEQPIFLRGTKEFLCPTWP
ncbi:MAG: transposase, partial [Candidatus Saccharimonadales bacterium]